MKKILITINWIFTELFQRSLEHLRFHHRGRQHRGRADGRVCGKFWFLLFLWSQSNRTMPDVGLFFGFDGSWRKICNSFDVNFPWDPGLEIAFSSSPLDPQLSLWAFWLHKWRESRIQIFKSNVKYLEFHRKTSSTSVFWDCFELLDLSNFSDKGTQSESCCGLLYNHSRYEPKKYLDWKK